MKTYICKEDLVNAIINDPGDALFDYEGAGIDEIVESMPTVTKAGICREFMKKVLIRTDEKEIRMTMFVMEGVINEMESEKD